MADVGKLAVSLSLDGGQFQRGMDRAAAQAQTFSTQAQASFQSLAGGLKSFGADPFGNLTGSITSVLGMIPGLNLFTVGVTAVTGALGALASSSANSINQTAKMAERFGTSVEGMIGLSAAARQLGVDNDELGTGLNFLSRKLGQVRAGSQQAIASFESFGLDARALANLPTDRALAVIAEKYVSLGNAADRTALTFEIFGRHAQGIIPILRHGGGGLDEAREQARQLGLMVSEADALQVKKSSRAAKIARAAVASVGESLGNTLAISLAPAIEKLSGTIVEGVKGMQPTIQGFAEVLAAAGKLVGGAVEAFRETGRAVAESGAAGKAFKFLATPLIQHIGTALQAFKPAPPLLTGTPGERELRRPTGTTAADVAATAAPVVGAEMARLQALAARTVGLAQIAADRQAFVARSRPPETPARPGLALPSVAGGVGAGEAAAEAAAERNREVRTYLEQLREQTATLGLTANSAKLYTLALHGATQAQLDAIRVAQQARDRRELINTIGGQAEQARSRASLLNRAMENAVHPSMLDDAMRNLELRDRAQSQMANATSQAPEAQALRQQIAGQQQRLRALQNRDADALAQQQRFDEAATIQNRLQAGGQPDEAAQRLRDRLQALQGEIQQAQNANPLLPNAAVDLNNLDQIRERVRELVRLRNNPIEVPLRIQMGTVQNVIRDLMERLRPLDQVARDRIAREQDAQIRNLELQQQALRQANMIRQAWEGMLADRQRLTEQTMTVGERFQEEIRRLDALRESGAIGENLQARGVLGLLGRTEGQLGLNRPTQLAGAVTQGSAAAFDAVNRARMEQQREGQTVQERIERIQAALLTVEKNQERILGQVVDILRQQGLPELLPAL